MIFSSASLTPIGDHGKAKPAFGHRVDHEDVGFRGIRFDSEAGALEAAVFRPQTGYYNNLAEEAAALIESLTNKHAFLDGNKRAAFDAITAHIQALSCFG